MDSNDEIPTLPVVGWTLHSVPAIDALLISLSYLTHATQRPEDAQERTFVLHTGQAEELAQRILALLARAKDAPTPASSPPKH